MILSLQIVINLYRPFGHQFYEIFCGTNSIDGMLDHWKIINFRLMINVQSVRLNIILWLFR